MEKAELDKLVLHYLDSVDRYSSCQAALSEDLAQAFVKLARARYLGTQVDASSFKQTYEPHLTTSKIVTDDMTAPRNIAVCMADTLSSAGRNVEPDDHRHGSDKATIQKHGTSEEMESQDTLSSSNENPSPPAPAETEAEQSVDKTLDQLGHLHLITSSKPRSHQISNTNEPASVMRKAKSNRRAQTDPLHVFGAMPSSAIREAQQSFMRVVERGIAAVNARRALEELEVSIESHKRLNTKEETIG